MIVQFSIYPIQSEHQSQDIATVVQILESAGLDYRLGPTSTAVEGEWDDVMAAIKSCHAAVAANNDRVISTITIDDRKEQPHSLSEMISSVEQSIGHEIKR